LPDENNVVRLQEELIGVKLREAEALTGLKELRQQVRDLEDHWQVNIHTHIDSCFFLNIAVCVIPTSLLRCCNTTCSPVFMLPINTQMFQ